ncbi:MAG: porin family protein [Cellvibrionaceae bacterium]
MKSLRRSAFIHVLLVISFLGFSAMTAADFWGNNSNAVWYAGVSVGVSDVEYNYPNRSDFKDQVSVYSVSGGVNFLTYFSLELSSYSFASARDDIELDVSQGSNSIAADGIEIDMFSTSIVGRLPIGKSVSIVGKIGAGHWMSNESISGFKDDDSGSQFVSSIGVDFFVNDKISVVADLLFIDVEPVHFNQKTTLGIELWSLGAKYYF